jgi:hypothetical protein
MATFGTCGISAACGATTVLGSIDAFRSYVINVRVMTFLSR